MRMFEDGAAAERLDTLTARGWRLLRDVRWPGRPLAHIDLLLVGPGGVVVVIHPCDGEGSMPLAEREEALAAAAAVAALLQPQHRRLVRAAPCETRRDRVPERVDGPPSDRVMAWCGDLPDALPRDDVGPVADHLERLLSGPTTPDQITAGQVLASPPGPPETPSSTPAPVRRARSAIVGLLLGLALVTMAWGPIASAVDSVVASYLANAESSTMIRTGIPTLMVPAPSPAPAPAPSEPAAP